MELEKLKEIVKEKLSEKRYKHSLNVMTRCEELARKFGQDVLTAKKIGLCHDIAKEMSDTEKLEYIKKYNIKIDEIEKLNIGLLHAKIGADIAKRQFGFSQEMSKAIEAHTTGVIDMDIFDKILFIADRTSLDRNFSDIDFINNLVDQDIDKAILYILNKKIENQIEKNNLIHLNSINTRNSLIIKNM